MSLIENEHNEINIPVEVIVEEEEQSDNWTQEDLDLLDILIASQFLDI